MNGVNVSRPTYAVMIVCTMICLSVGCYSILAWAVEWRPSRGTPHLDGLHPITRSSLPRHNWPAIEVGDGDLIPPTDFPIFPLPR